MVQTGGRPKGHAKTGGRKHGTPNRLSGHQEAKRLVRQQKSELIPQDMRAVMVLDLPPITIEEMHPLRVINAIMLIRWNAGDYAGALVAAIALAPYTNARLSSSEIRLTHELATLSDEELQAQALAYERKLAAANGETIDGEVVH